MHMGGAPPVWAELHPYGRSSTRMGGAPPVWAELHPYGRSSTRMGGALPYAHTGGAWHFPSVAYIIDKPITYTLSMRCLRDISLSLHCQRWLYFYWLLSVPFLSTHFCTTFYVSAGFFEQIGWRSEVKRAVELLLGLLHWKSFPQ